MELNYPETPPGCPAVVDQLNNWGPTPAAPPAVSDEVGSGVRGLSQRGSVVGVCC